jgi:hypothetical protein
VGEKNAMVRIGGKVIGGRYPRFILLVALLVTIFLLNTIALFTIFTSRGQFVIWDFHPILLAGKAVLQGVDPYSAEVTEAIQELDYGRLANPGEDIQAFAYPLFVALLQIPFTLLPLPWAQAAWLALLEGLTLATIVLLLRVWNISAHFIFRGFLIVWSLVFYPIVWGLILGQMALLAFFWITLSVFAIQKKKDLVGGLALGLTLIKPTLSFLIIPGILVWALVCKRWRVIGGAILAMILVVGLPTIVQPNWMTQFWKRLNEYHLYSQFPPPFNILLQGISAEAAAVIETLITLSLLSIFVYSWIHALRKKNERTFLWAVGFSIILTTTIAPSTHIINQVVLLLPILGVVEGLRRRDSLGKILASLLQIFWGGILWLLSLMPPISTASPRYLMEHRVLSPILPLSIGVIWFLAFSMITRVDFSRSQSVGMDIDASVK